MKLLYVVCILSCTLGAVAGASEGEKIDDKSRQLRRNRRGDSDIGRQGSTPRSSSNRFRIDRGGPTGPPPTPNPPPSSDEDDEPTDEPTYEPTKSPSADPPPRPTPASSPTSSSNSEAQAWLKAHNSRREDLHRSYGKTPSLLKWSNDLAASAQNYANMLLELDECDIEHDYKGDEYGGENLYCNWGSSDNRRDPDGVLVRWWDRQVDEDYGDNGHFTQAAWYATEYLGCAWSHKTFYERDGDFKYCYIHVCRYLRPGNCNMNKKDWEDNMIADYSGCGVDEGLDCPAEGCF